MVHRSEPAWQGKPRKCIGSYLFSFLILRVPLLACRLPASTNTVSVQCPLLLAQVPTLAYESEAEPQLHTVYESLICNEFLEVGRIPLIIASTQLPWGSSRSQNQASNLLLGYPVEFWIEAGQTGRESNIVQDLATNEEQPALLPPHPAVKARARIIMDHFNTQFVPLFYRILVRYWRLMVLDATVPTCPDMVILGSQISRKAVRLWCGRTCFLLCLIGHESLGHHNFAQHHSYCLELGPSNGPSGDS